MTTGDALLRRILEVPADDTARLVYADWLQENGDEARAEFVRVQCKIALLETGSTVADVRCEKCARPTAWHRYSPRCRGMVCKLRQREYYTSRRFCVWDWCRGIPAGSQPVYRRGFVCEIRLPLAAFREHAEAMFRAHPIERVTLTDKRPSRHSGGAGDRGGFWWEPGIQHDQPRQVPFEIGEAGCKAGAWKTAFHGGLMVYVHPRNKERGCPPARGFETELDALSDACVAYGRSLAGLSVTSERHAISSVS